MRIVGWTLGLGLIAVALVAGWLALRMAVDRAPTGRSAQVATGSLDDLLMDLQLLPLEGQSPKPFTLESLDGRRVALADLAGRPALLYFWATW